MIAQLARLAAARLHSDPDRLAAGILSLLLLGLSFGSGYIAALSVGSIDAIRPDEQPLVATIDHRGAGLAAPRPTAAASPSAAPSTLTSTRSARSRTALLPLSPPSSPPSARLSPSIPL